MCGGPGTPPSPVLPPKKDDTEVQAAKDRQAELLRKKQGRSSTIVTGSQGVLQSEETKAQKTLLGQ